jgi:hypothetical protein
VLTLHDPHIFIGGYSSNKTFLIGSGIFGCIFANKSGINFLLVNTSSSSMSFEVWRIHKFETIVKRHRQNTIVDRFNDTIRIFTCEGDNKNAGQCKVLEFNFPL